METPESTPEETTPEEQQDDDGQGAGGPAFDPNQAEGDDAGGDAQ